MRHIIFFAFIIYSSAIYSQPWSQRFNSEKNYFELKDEFYKYYGDKKYQKGKGYNLFKRWEYRWEAKTFPDGIFPEGNKYIDEYKKFNLLNKNQTNNSNWIPLGIASWQNGYSGYNPGNGRLNSVTVASNNPNIIYACSPSGGVWKTTDFGQNWTTTYDTISLLGTSSVAIDPVNNNIIYVGTGDRDGSDTKSIGVLKSTDGGITWQTTSLTYAANTTNVNKILINPLNPNTIFAATDSRIYRSYNAGISWTSVYLGGFVSDLKFKPGDTTVIYGAGSRFIRSTNSGTTFSNITSGLPSNLYRKEIAVTVANPEIVYLIGCLSTDYSFGGIYKSTNGGTSFSTMSTTPNILGYESDGSDEGGQGYYDLTIEASQIDENKIFTGGVNIWSSDDGGINLYPLTGWYYNSGQEYVHADIHKIEFFGNRLFTCTDGGVFYSDDYGQTWSDISSGLEITQFYRLGISKGSVLKIAAGAQDNGSNVFYNGNWTHVYGADGMEAIVNPSNLNTFFVTSQNGNIMRSTNGGTSFTSVSPTSDDGGWITPYAMSETNPSTLIAGYKDVYKTTNSGTSWTKISTNLSTGNLKCLAMAYSNNNYIYASYANKLFVTKDGGANWASYNPSITLSITGITIDKTNPEKIWLSLSSSSSDAVYYSIDAGLNCTNIKDNLTNLGFNTICAANNGLNGVYLGTETGIFYRDTLLNQWIEFSNQLPNVIINELDINYVTGKIYAATYGRGIWVSDIYDNTISIKNIVEENIIIQNPVNENLYITLNEFYENLYIISVSGKLAKEKNIYNSLEHTINVKDLQSGTYYVKIISKNKKDIIKKIIIL